MRAVIADDEPLARRVIRDLLADESDITIVGEARNGIETVAAIRASTPDLLFLDVGMPDLDGFGVLNAIEAGTQPHTIFVTAYDEFAVRAFEAEALDYLVKPFTDERFRKTLARVRQRLAQGATRGYVERIPVTVGRRTHWIDVASAHWIEADDYCARLHTAKGTYLARVSLAALERRLDAETFLRVHRGALVNRGSVKCLLRERGGAQVLVLVTGSHVPVSERRVRAVREWLARRGPGFRP